MAKLGTRGEWIPAVMKHFLLLAAVFFTLIAATNSLAVTINVEGVDKAGNATTLAVDYRWLIERDDNYHVQFDAANQPIPDAETLAVNFHQSYMPVVAKGTSADLAAQVAALDPGHYAISVIPSEPGLYSIGGTTFSTDEDVVTVYLNQLPLPTAQISIFIFEDIAPVNGIPDLPEEVGLEGYQILLEDGGGRYGMSAGAQTADAFGNKLGTVYVQTCDIDGQNPGSGTYGCLDADGAPIVETDNQGNAIIEPLVSGPDGYVTIKNLAPGKYGIQAVPPTGSGYQQTSTIEGTKVIDAWVKANEPPYFLEFGPAGVHVFIGFAKEYHDSTVLNGGQTISGQVVNLHLSRPPESAFYNGGPFEHTTPWIGLNDNAGLAGSSRALHISETGPNGTFTIPNVPPGDYQLAIWDSAMDIVIGFKGITVTDTGCLQFDGTVAPCDLQEVPVFQWFTRLENWVFNDDGGGNPALAGNGIRDPGEVGLPEQAINLRWRDGTMNQSMATDLEGFVPFDQVFPFFAWQVAEVDFARFKATGATVYVDDGGPVPFGTEPGTFEVFRNQLNPQIQNNPTDPDSTSFPPYGRTETGMILTEAYQGFLGQTSVIEWGKQAYAPGENGGISGIVFYSTTRAEDDPKYGAAEPWEPGIPRVTVNLYDSTGTTLLNTTTTDSWDDSVPENCQYGSSPYEPFNYLGTDRDCYDGMRVWNQVRPGVFDGGYAFTTIYQNLAGNTVPFGTADAVEVSMPAGEYVVEVIPPNGYEIVKSQDINVTFGDSYIPAPQLLPAECVGESYLVSEFLSLFPGVPSPLAGEQLPLCDRKQVLLSDGANAAADFFLFTEVPISGHIFGIILDDTANEFDITSPQFGEKYAPPFMPIGIYDWTGRLISHTYSDAYGRFNTLVPSTATANLPQPSGMSPNMLTTCMNDSNPEADPMGRHNSQYSSFCYVFQYMPGTTTYLDTPVVPVAAFAGPDQYPLDAELPDGTPRIHSVTAGAANGVGGGPYVPAAGSSLTINSMGMTAVPDPASPVGGTTDRDYGFGADPGTVTINGVPMTNLVWSDSQITGTVAPGTTTGQLVVTRANGTSTVVGLTVQVGTVNNRQNIVSVTPGDPDAAGNGPIQQAIDAAGVNDVILVGPGVYDELVVMWKPVRLQGWGEGSTTISAVKTPQNKLQNLRDKLELLVTNGDVSLLPQQEVAFGGIEPGTLFTEEGAGVLVLARASGNRSFAHQDNKGARVDGFTITSADTGGGIVVNGYGDYLQIGNNRIINNSGFFGGGVRLGHPTLDLDGRNDYVTIHHNHILKNGGLNGAGGGVSLYTGSDSYQVTDNYISGNFTMGDGAGVGHLGLSDRAGNGNVIGNAPSIKDNTILFNQNFNQAVQVSGGGIFIGGQPQINGALTNGAGSVVIDSNLIQGNHAEAGDGGGIRLSLINGEDVTNNPNLQGNKASWHRVDIINNMIVNNVAALAGGGISMQDAAMSYIVSNTVANNDSTATSSGAFTAGNPNSSTPQPAGIVSRAHSTALNNAIGNNAPAQYQAPFSNPLLVDNIVWHNRSFYFFGDPGDPTQGYQLLPDVPLELPVYDDLAVLGVAGSLNPTYSIFSEDYTGAGAADPTNILTADAGLVGDYLNGGRGTTVKPGEQTTTFVVPVAFDEGGNFIQVRYGPLTPEGSDYHLTTGSLAIDKGTLINQGVPYLSDFDGEPRPQGDGVDIGADEAQ